MIKPIFFQVLYSISLLFSLLCNANTIFPNLPNVGVISENQNGFLDKKVDYEKFFGRISDKGKDNQIFKIKVENNNTKFLRVGDIVYFKIPNHPKDKTFCRGSVRTIEDFYFSIHVNTLAVCTTKNFYLKIGTILNFFSKDLGKRVYEASNFRTHLLLKKEGFLQQLNEINHFLYTYEEQKVKLAMSYDQRINELKNEKQKAIDSFLQKKHESIILQNELKIHLNQLDESLEHYLIERQEYLADRWNEDHDQEKPVAQRPGPWKNKY